MTVVAAPLQPLRPTGSSAAPVVIDPQRNRLSEARALGECFQGGVGIKEARSAVSGEDRDKRKGGRQRLRHGCGDISRKASLDTCLGRLETVPLGSLPERTIK